MIIRPQIKTLQAHLEEPRRFIQVLAGPRQIGKTTLVGQLVERLQVPTTSISADAVDPENTEWIADQWAAVRKTMELAKESEHILIIDEIQRLTNWSEMVKREWDYDTRYRLNIKVILLGSSRLLIQDGLNESLAGRFELIHMPHWSYGEMKEAFGFSLEQYIYFGGYPGAAPLIQDEKRWRNYMRHTIINPSVEKDVLMTKRILKPELMRRLFVLGASYSAEIVAFNKLLGQLQDAGNTTTMANYLTVLDEADLLCGLQQYSPDKIRRYRSIPKFQVFNTALQSACQTNTFSNVYIDRQRWGRWVESAVGAHLLNGSADGEYLVCYWRDGDDETDFVLVRGEEVLGIEVKSGRRTAGNGLAAFKKRFPGAKTLVVGTGGLDLELFFRTQPEQLF